ncbi:MAG: hypothetical protein ACOCX0_02635 [Bacteroidota bacterium]
MKSLHLTLIFMVIFMIMGFDIEPDDKTFTEYTPILLKRSDLPASVFMQPAKDFSNPEKIYIYNDHIYIVDLFSGIHVINNQDPSNPQKTGFIHIPGCMDLAIKNEVLYADNAIDLVSVDLSNYPQIAVLDRVEDVFPEPTPPDMTWIPWAWSPSKRPSDTVIVGWQK